MAVSGTCTSAAGEKSRPPRMPILADEEEGHCDRDRKVLKLLAAAGWQPFVVWECHTRNRDELRNRLVNFLA